MSAIVLASNNKGKLREIQQILAPLELEVVPQAKFEIEDADETGLSFVENAIIKARHAANKSGLPALADDSGIVVDALNGRPGIYSARYAGLQASDQQNVDKLLEEMKDVSDDQRGAHFQCAMVFVRNAKDPVPIICQGSWHGRILHQVQGDNGFGYDPLLFLPKENKTSAQLSSELKNKLSHRGQALQRLLLELKALDKIK